MMTFPAEMPHKKRTAAEVAISFGGNFSMKDLQKKAKGLSYPLCKSAVEWLLDKGILIKAGKKGKAELFKNSGTKISAPTSNGNGFVAIEEVAQDTTLPVETQYANLNSLVRMIGNGTAYSLIVSGMPGVGKTHSVMTTLRSMGIEVPEADENEPSGEDGEEARIIVVKGKASPMGLYKTLHDNRRAIIIFDDCDSVFLNSDATNLLKSALDFQRDRRISWVSMASTNQGLDQSFKFTGQILFITNKFVNELDTAVCSRAYVAEINLSKPQVLEHLVNIHKEMDIYPGDPANAAKCTEQVRVEVLDFMEKNMHKINKFDLRTFIKGVQLCVGSPENWKNILMNQVK